MKTELEEIKKELESTLEGFKDAYEDYGYDLANERYYVETALKKVNLLLLHIVSNNEERVTVCPTCENTFPHLYKDKGGHCEECNTEWAN